MDTLAAYLDRLIAHIGHVNVYGCADVPKQSLTLEALYVPPGLSLEDSTIATMMPTEDKHSDRQETVSHGHEELLQQRLSIDNLWDIHPYWVIVGAPGCGKRTLIRYEALRCAKQWRHYGHGRLPLYFEWRDFAAVWQAHPEWDNRQALYQYLCTTHPLGSEALTHALCARQVLLVGEALDWANGDNIQPRCLEALESLLQEYPGNRCLISARDAPFSPNMRYVRVQAFNDQHLQRFFYLWFRAWETQESDSKMHSEALWRQVKARTDLYHRLNTPFLCVLTGLSALKETPLPSMAIELYQHTLECFILAHKKSAGFNDAEAMQRHLEEIALSCVDSTPAPELMLLPRLLHEYLAARALLRDPARLAHILEKHVFEPRWRHIIRLIAAQQGIVHDSSATAFIKQLQTCTHPRDAQLYYSFRLAFECMRASRVSFQLADYMFHTWIHLYQQQPALHPTLIRLLRQGAPLEYKPGAITPLLDALKANTVSARIDAADALGCLHDHNSLPLLIDLLKQDPYPLVRAKAAEVLGNFGSSTALPALLAGLRSDNAFGVRRQCALVLAQFERNTTVPVLLTALRDRDPTARWRAAEALAYVKDYSTLPVLLELLRHDDVPGVRWRVAETLGQLQHESTLAALIHTLQQDTDLNVRSRAAEALGYFPATQTRAVLQQALKQDKFPAVRWRAAESLGRQGDTLALTALFEALSNDLDNAVRWSAAEALGRMRDHAAVTILCKTMREDFDVSVRWSAAEALGNLGDTDAVAVLLLALKHERFASVRAKICQALGRLRDQSATPALLQLLSSDPSGIVRTRAAEALGGLGDNMAVAALLAQLPQDFDANVRWSIAAALAHFRDPGAISVLLRCFEHDPDVNVRQRAAQTLEILDMGALI
jgi:HEAT repeat protein